MRPSTLILALPALATAQQIPLLDQVKGWLGMAADAVPSAVSSVVSDPVATKPARNFEKGKVDAMPVETITLENYERLLKPAKPMPSQEYEEWMLLVTGGNRTCFGACAKAEEAFHSAVPALALTSRPLHVGTLNCEEEEILCSMWLVEVPSIMHMFMPHPIWDQPGTVDSIVRYIDVNRTSIERGNVIALLAQNEYKSTEPYTGVFHPFNGPLAQTGANFVLGYVLHYSSKIPSWAFMIGMSFLSRTIMSRRTNPGHAAQAPAAQ